MGMGVQTSVPVEISRNGLDHLSLCFKFLRNPVLFFSMAFPKIRVAM